ncbi:hypothetical protein [Mycobacteroides abscessus]|uniref:Sensor domain-containing protein n=1 Tax=Mycobacteroides abscessus subsp. bolletii CRM-0020 TaxID=1306401 RepID=A0A829HU16_9MYCO|nr:hypothetical protein [Mycobacteroides abscessus]ESV59416.1 hypothetical protein L830_1630 [Mycobacteroides abscessus MAB_082312_2258]AMU26845.1 hypothetical protein A3N96_16845 [Mycobacteroides abscessus]AMU31666.1 hypothetical protein A3N97_14565 [Mycobacteroides abscessus]AMU36530.1 hypothetical protein A3N98_16040 [Mycobacteroides abscessus]AMU41575.1 hypothetical protein A3N99_16630 [Mycobacteroides abscessus]
MTVTASRLVATMVVAACCTAIAPACTRAIDGSAVEASGSATPATPSPASAVRAPAGPVGPLLLAPTDFPHQYPATTLEPEAAGSALREIRGVPDAATVIPTACAPAPLPAVPQDAAVAVGTNQSDNSTITVAVLRVAEPLATYKSQLQRCASFTFSGPDQIQSTVTASEAVAPPINADDSVAVNQAVSPAGTGGGTQTTLSLIAQIADIRIQATYTTFQGTEPDAVLLDQAFTAAVLKVHDNVR